MKKFLISCTISLSFTLIYLEQLSNILIKIGEKINTDSTAFLIGYSLISLLIIGIYINLICNYYIHNKKVNFIILYLSSTYILYTLLYPPPYIAPYITSCRTRKTCIAGFKQPICLSLSIQHLAPFRRTLTQ